MTKYLVIDTETSGLFDFKQPADAEGQPRMAQFGCIMLDAGEGLALRYSTYIRPDGWEMPSEAGAVNGLTTEFLAANGVPVAEVLDFYTKAILDGFIVVAFNAQFDCKVLRAELRRAGRDDLFDRTPNICVMRACTDILQLPRRRGGGFKFPNLAEACAHFGIENKEAHDAMGDADAALEIMRRLNAAGQLPEPKVHYAKEAA